MQACQTSEWLETITWNSRLWNLARSCDKTSARLANRGPVLVHLICCDYGDNLAAMMIRHPKWTFIYPSLCQCNDNVMKMINFDWWRSLLPMRIYTQSNDILYHCNHTLPLQCKYHSLLKLYEASTALCARQTTARRYGVALIKLTCVINV